MIMGERVKSGKNIEEHLPSGRERRMGYVSSFPGEVDITLIKAAKTNSFPETDSDIVPQKMLGHYFLGPGLFSGASTWAPY